MLRDWPTALHHRLLVFECQSHRRALDLPAVYVPTLIWLRDRLALSRSWWVCSPRISLGGKTTTTNGRYIVKNEAYPSGTLTQTSAILIEANQTSSFAGRA